MSLQVLRSGVGINPKLRVCLPETGLKDVKGRDGLLYEHILNSPP